MGCTFPRGTRAWEKERSAAETCAVDTCSGGVWFTGSAGGVSVGCLAVRSRSTEVDVAMPKDVSADAARDRSPSEANVSARRVLTSICSG